MRRGGGESFGGYPPSWKAERPWRSELITPTTTPETPGNRPTLRTGLHAHFYSPELADDFMRKLAPNRGPCDLLLSTNTVAKTEMLRTATVGYDRGEVLIRVVPNRRRDLGPLLTGFAKEVSSGYDLIGHLHGKRTLQIDDGRLGERWREFLWRHLVGDRHPMMDIILDRFATDETLGLVLAADPHLERLPRRARTGRRDHPARPRTAPAVCGPPGRLRLHRHPTSRE